MNRLAGIFLVLFLIAIAFAATLGYAFETKPLVTTTSVRTTTLTNSGTVESVTITEEIIGVVTPQTATIKIIVSPASPNCTILIPTLVTPILGYNTTEYVFASQNLSATFSIVSTVTTFSQMPSAQTAFTTITESGNIEVNTTITSNNSTITTSTCPVYA
jgi:hypothetical protein